MRYYRVNVAVPFDDSISDAEAQQRMENWLATNDGTETIVIPATAAHHKMAEHKAAERLEDGDA